LATAPKAPIAVPTLDEVLRAPQRVTNLPAQVLLGLSAGAAAVQSTLASELLARGATQDQPQQEAAQDDRWLTPEEAAPILRKDRRWIYRNQRTLPFVRRISARSLLCSESGIHRWLATRRAS
jgi:hypothetical protein